MDGKSEIEVSDWELVQNDEPIVSVIDELNSDLSIIRSDHFSIPINIPNSISSSSSSNSEIDRNFDDSYVANQLFSNPIVSPSCSSSSSNLRRWNDSDSDSELAVNAAAATIGGGTEVDEVGFESNSKEEEEEEEEEKEVKEDDMKRVVWWKVPFEVLKHWVTPLSIPLPLSVAAAAAFLGLLILGRRLYKMKRKTQALKLNLALDDKRANCEHQRGSIYLPSVHVLVFESQPGIYSAPSHE
ncbi:uncharacterized protein [Cicer arietinum]|uniref:Uncharacterized protein LOC101497750 isoform X2 n=1 Tax=Cicer arietinum TaxID=3827 RepID=A0A3Q7XRV5_CICAR|nr:uncharacterized protein LOC101497750 isoform X2 [Cicer arietinum]